MQPVGQARRATIGYLVYNVRVTCIQSKSSKICRFDIISTTKRIIKNRRSSCKCTKDAFANKKQIENRN